METLAGRSAFVTGGARGIGFALACALAAAGMRVAIADADAQAVLAAARAIRGAGKDVLPISLDVRDRDAWQAAADQFEASLGPLHLLCNNAGVASVNPVEALTFGDWDWTLGVNLGGVVNGIQTCLPRMLAHGEGAHIVNTASMAGIVGQPGMAHYHASKFAVVGLSESIAAELAPKGIGVSVLCPGFVDTRIFEADAHPPADVELGGRSDADRAAFRAQAMPVAISPESVADRVVEAVRENRFWIFTHGQYEANVRERMEAMLAAFPPPPDA